MSLLRALQIEDLDDDAALVRAMLRAGGYEVHARRVDTEAELRSALREGPWDIVLADYSLPSFDARRALEVLEECGLGIPVIVMSGTVGEDIAVETLQHGAEDYLLKQNLTRLVPAVERALAAAAGRRHQTRLEHMNNLILATSLDLICTFDTEGRFREAGAASQTLLGVDPAELAGTSIAGLAHPDDAPSMSEAFATVLTGRPVRDLECRFVRRTGEVVYLTWSLVLSVVDEMVVGVANDISERKRTEEALRVETARFEAQVESSLDGILVVDRRGRKVIHNQRLTEMWGLPPEVVATDDNMLQVKFASRLTADPEAFLDRVMWLTDHPQEVGDDQIDLADGRVIERYSAPVVDREGHYYGRTWIHRDITERRQAEERIRHLATHDDLTGLPNRNLIQDRIVEAIARARETGRRLALLYVDLDRFKVINDGYGHPFGNAVLKAVGERLAERVGATGVVARLGGDEFLVLLDDLREEHDADRLAHDLVACVAAPLEVDGREVHVSGSVGMSVFPADGDTAEELIGNADVAMYRAKDLGRNTYQPFTRQMSEETQQRIDLETRLRRAAEAGQLRLVYQPKVSLATGGITGCEALLRWTDPVLGEVPPTRFIPIAEDSGLIVPIGDWVLRAACTQARAWTDAGLPPVTVGVNLSARQFLQQDVVAWVLRTLADTGLPANLLELELTEGLIAQDAEKVIATFGRLKTAGVKLSIDDFGTGYSSLSYLKRFRVDTLKIDQSFVRNMLTQQEDATIVQAIISLANSLGFTVIAEGVETERHCTALRAAGCDEIQGHFFAEPVGADEFAAMLRAGKHLQ